MVIIMKNAKVDLKPAKWVRLPLFCALTGHTPNTAKHMRAQGVWKLGVHYKGGPEGPRCLYYNIEAIDKLITEHKHDVTG